MAAGSVKQQKSFAILSHGLCPIREGAETEDGCGVSVDGDGSREDGDHVHAETGKLTPVGSKLFFSGDETI
jgi:hypothetical protein